MIILDTNVISEPIKTRPDERVLTWLRTRSRLADTAITSVTVGELLDGVRALPHGRRRDALLEVVESAIRLSPSRVVPYDEPAARAYAEIREECRHGGIGLGVEDGMIAAIARSRGASLATRNVKDFERLGIPLVNPWDAQA